MPEQFQISERLQAFIKRWPSRVTADVPQIQDFSSVNYPSPRLGTANKSTSLFFSKSDGTLDQIFVADSVFGNVTQTSQY